MIEKYAKMSSGSDFEGVEAKGDVEPTSGTLYFPTGQQSQILSLDVLADDVPEGNEASNNFPLINVVFSKDSDFFEYKEIRETSIRVSRIIA